MKQPLRHRRVAGPRRMGGLTLIELMVAMALGLLIVLASVAALTVARRGFTTVDAAAQLRDNGRFAADVVGRIGVQAGYRDVYFAARQRQGAANPEPHVMGFNNALIDPVNPLATATARASDTAPGWGSDILILRYQAAQLHFQSTDPVLKLISDKTMIDCAGNPAPAVIDIDDPTARDQRMASILHVAVNQGEPTLMCSYSTDGIVFGGTTPIAQGVENFQVLYGVDSVTANTAPAATLPSPNVPTAYLRADQMAVAGNTAATNANWRRVRSIKIGMVLRGAPDSTQDRAAQTFYPFGEALSGPGGAKGSAFASNADPGTAFTPTPDGRLRKTVSFTIHLRNDQGA